MNKASIYKYIENRKALIECAACRIEIFEKSGNEHISYDALSELRSVTTILGMERSITHDLPKGIIITDDLSMDAVKQYVEDGNAATMAINAGNDMIITDDFISMKNEVIKAVEDGSIKEETINKAVTRIIAWKYYSELL